MDVITPLVHLAPILPDQEIGHADDMLNAGNNFDNINNVDDNKNNPVFIESIILKKDIIIDDTDLNIVEINNHNDMKENKNDMISDEDNNDNNDNNDNDMISDEVISDNENNENNNDDSDDNEDNDDNEEAHYHNNDNNPNNPNNNEEYSEEYDGEEAARSDTSSGAEDIDTEYIDLHHCQKVFDKVEYDKIFDEDTTIKYKKYRQKKKDPVTSEVLTDENAFKFKYMWNSISGERTGVDPNGPIYISPVTILKMIYHNILRGLWLEIDGCLPMYGEFLGCGYDFYSPGKGAQPEKYIFRFPIKDCYIYKNQDQSIHTTGPKLTITELKEIDNLIIKYWSNDEFIRRIRPKARSTIRLRKYYDIALCKPSNGIPSYLTDLPKKMNNIFLDKLSRNMISVDNDTFLNRLAVDMIKRIINYGGYYDEY